MKLLENYIFYESTLHIQTMCSQKPAINLVNNGKHTFDSYRLNVCIFDVADVGIGQTQYLVLVLTLKYLNKKHVSYKHIRKLVGDRRTRKCLLRRAQPMRISGSLNNNSFFLKQSSCINIFVLISQLEYYSIWLLMDAFFFAHLNFVQCLQSLTIDDYQFYKLRNISLYLRY
ncbi:hypothetical protein AGLY_017803 [Aphis glycines]|uniref:Uncharacterized protein n=1 Tax=Aphis glycines TaxID=307491 RepID=A0A6G0SU57_APHGL|nr:hypothetical protein AGLY_017803 [Aphis glycines]